MEKGAEKCMELSHGIELESARNPPLNPPRLGPFRAASPRLGHGQHGFKGNAAFSRNGMVINPSDRSDRAGDRARSNEKVSWSVLAFD
jgi:hypothetical protein